MLAAVGYPVRKLERIGMGPVRLKGLSRGSWRELTREEIRDLRKAGAQSVKAEQGAQQGASGAGGANGSGGGKPSGGVQRYQTTPGQGIQEGESERPRRIRKRNQPKKAPYMSPTAGQDVNIRNRSIKNAINRAGNEQGFVKKPVPIVEPDETGAGGTPDPKPQGKGPSKPQGKPGNKPGKKPDNRPNNKR